MESSYTYTSDAIEGCHSAAGANGHGYRHRDRNGRRARDRRRPEAGLALGSARASSSSRCGVAMARDERGARVGPSQEDPGPRAIPAPDARPRAGRSVGATRQTVNAIEDGCCDASSSSTSPASLPRGSRMSSPLRAGAEAPDRRRIRVALSARILDDPVVLRPRKATDLAAFPRFCTDDAAVGWRGDGDRAPCAGPGRRSGCAYSPDDPAPRVSASASPAGKSSRGASSPSRTSAPVCGRRSGPTVGSSRAKKVARGSGSRGRAPASCNTSMSRTWRDSSSGASQPRRGPRRQAASPPARSGG